MRWNQQTQMGYPSRFVTLDIMCECCVLLQYFHKRLPIVITCIAGCCSVAASFEREDGARRC